jgi:hypothetical protein
MMKIGIIIPTYDLEKAAACQARLADLKSGPAGNLSFSIIEGQFVLPAMAQGAALHRESDLLMFIHDDVEVLEPGWDVQATNLFELDKRIGMVGWGGALRLGTPDLYKKPYKLNQLARIGFYSNMEDAEAHGKRSTVPMQVSVLDGFCQILKSEAYWTTGGWEAAMKDGLPPFHMYDAWMACAMEEIGYRTWMVPTRCKHRGGETSIGARYHEKLAEAGWKNDTEVHKAAHKVIYERFDEVLPLTVIR